MMTGSEAAACKDTLLSKQRELENAIARLEDEAREGINTDVQDPVDQLTSGEAKAVAFQTGGMESELLTQVKDALGRLNDGSYGRCVICGRMIEKARLAAVPWTPYCLEDQEELDRKKALNDSTAV